MNSDTLKMEIYSSSVQNYLLSTPMIRETRIWSALLDIGQACTYFSYKVPFYWQQKDVSSVRLFLLHAVGTIVARLAATQ